MPYPQTTPPHAPTKHGLPAKPPQRFNVADEPARRFSARTLFVIAVSLFATAISLYRIRDTFRQETPPPSPYQELLKTNPEYADLIGAIRDRDYDHVERAITKNPWLVNFSRPESFGSPLLIAAFTNQPDVIDLLAERGADMNVKGRWGGTALHFAAWRGSADAVDALVHHGADVNARSDNDGSTPLFWACRGSREGFFSRNNHAAVVKILLASGADPEVANVDGFYPAAIASDEIVPLLLQHGATPRPPATQPTFGTMQSGERPWGFGFRRMSGGDSAGGNGR
jgi:hypothetical protein